MTIVTFEIMRGTSDLSDVWYSTLENPDKIVYESETGNLSISFESEVGVPFTMFRDHEEAFNWLLSSEDE